MRAGSGFLVYIVKVSGSGARSCALREVFAVVIRARSGIHEYFPEGAGRAPLTLG